MKPKAIVFDLFHTLTGFESEWSDLPFTCDVLGIDRRVWNPVITTGSRWRLAGEERERDEAREGRTERHGPARLAVAAPAVKEPSDRPQRGFSRRNK